MRLINEHFWKFFVGLAALLILGITVIFIAQKYQDHTVSTACLKDTCE